MKVVIALNSAWNLLNFRAGLISALVSQGHSVVLAAPADKNVYDLEEMGARFVDIPMNSHGINPLSDLVLLWRYIKLLKNERPNALLTYTAKPNIYCSLAARILNVPVISNISGLGSVFINDGWLTLVLKSLYRISLARSHKVFFQNSDDLRYFLKHRIVDEDLTDLLPGSGVDLQKFQPAELPYFNETNKRSELQYSQFVFLLVGRMLREKGIAEYVQAARLVKKNQPNTVFALLGPLDTDNPCSISLEEFNSWVNEGVVDYWGISKDVRIQISKADCVVLPSYREGTPRSLLEAAAMSRPLIATNVPGCKEVIYEGVNGLMCRPRDGKSLASAMQTLLSMSNTKLINMGRASRLLAETKFDEKIVINKYINCLLNIERKIS